MMHSVLFSGLGGVVGYGYYRLVGCRSGLCPLTSNPIVSTIYGAVMGLLLSRSAG